MLSLTSSPSPQQNPPFMILVHKVAWFKESKNPDCLSLKEKAGPHGMSADSALSKRRAQQHFRSLPVFFCIGWWYSLLVMLWPRYRQMIMIIRGKWNWNLRTVKMV